MSNAKRDRGALRIIVKEMLPELMSTELYTQLQKENQQTLVMLQNLIKESLKRLEDRQKDLQAIIMHEVSKSGPKSE